MSDESQEILDSLKQTSVFIDGPDGTGTGYLIAPKRIATALHVVKSGIEGESYDVVVGVGGPMCQARLIKWDVENDAAILAFDEDGVSASPLPVASSLKRKALWEGYGYPAATGYTGSNDGLSIDGSVQDSNTCDDEGHPAILLFSEKIAAGKASPLHGFSGSPVLVDGAVVGHLRKHIGDPDDLFRAAYGYVYACPISAVVKLLDVEPTQKAISTPPVKLIAESVPVVGKNEFHVFVSYRSSDREWALSLVARLEGAGLKVFFDQKELVPGHPLAEQLQSALGRSRNAIVLVSKGWLESGWCQEEANVLIKRAAEEKSFKLIPVRLDDSTMPYLLDSRLWLDFHGVPRAEGPNVDRLLYALLDKPQPSPDSVVGRIEATNSHTIDECVEEIKAAAHNDSHRVLQVLRRWQQINSIDVAPLVAAAEVLVGQNRPDLALNVLKGARETLRVRQLRAFALAKSGDIDQAIELLEKLQSQGELDSETSGLLAGRYKTKWLTTRNYAYLIKAFQIYRDAFERLGDVFNGINAAGMALHIPKQDTAYRYKTATAVLNSLEQKSNAKPLDDPWDLASLGEALLLLERYDEAKLKYQEAAGLAAGKHQDIAVMRRQARLHLKALGQAMDRFDDVLPVPKVLVYFGHMVDAEDREMPRFPSNKVGLVRKAIRKRLAKFGPLYGFGTAARGSDILFLEALLERQCGATVVLPFPETEFLALSGGGQWNDRFKEITSNPLIEIQIIKDSRPQDEDLVRVFVDANKEVQTRALQFAKRLDETPIVIAVFDGYIAQDGPGGTADAISLWEDEGYMVDIIDLAAIINPKNG